VVNWREGSYREDGRCACLMGENGMSGWGCRAESGGVVRSNVGVMSDHGHGKNDDAYKPTTRFVDGRMGGGQVFPRAGGQPTCSLH
jgi:hypothetical protein